MSDPPPRSKSKAAPRLTKKQEAAALAAQQEAAALAEANAVPTQGTARFVFPCGSVYDGGWICSSIVQMDDNGNVTVTTPVPVITTTTSSNQAPVTKRKLRHGQGEWTHFGDKYTGEWAADYIQGSGCYVYSSGAMYTGQWKKNAYHGVGKYDWPEGAAHYEGEWVNNEMHGQGVLTITKTGDRFSGTWKHDQWLAADGHWTAPPVPMVYSQIIEG